MIPVVKSYRTRALNCFSNNDKPSNGKKNRILQHCIPFENCTSRKLQYDTEKKAQNNNISLSLGMWIRESYVYPVCNLNSNFNKIVPVSPLSAWTRLDVPMIILYLSDI